MGPCIKASLGVPSGQMSVKSAREVAVDCWVIGTCTTLVPPAAMALTVAHIKMNLLAAVADVAAKA